MLLLHCSGSALGGLGMSGFFELMKDEALVVVAAAFRDAKYWGWVLPVQHFCPWQAGHGFCSDGHGAGGPNTYLFLVFCLQAGVAESWGCRRVLNGFAGLPSHGRCTHLGSCPHKMLNTSLPS